ncbi:MAG: hypothetical protein AAB281_03765, partial [Actinomycetota bacterium]
TRRVRRRRAGRRTVTVGLGQGFPSSPRLFLAGTAKLSGILSDRAALASGFLDDGNFMATCPHTGREVSQPQRWRNGMGF